jgi:hypothetical protein
MTRTHIESKGAEDFAPLTLPMKKQSFTIDGCKVTINFNDRPDKTVIGEVKRIILDRLAKTS